MATKIFRLLKAAVCVVLIAQLAGCGTIMYPQRRGQHGGKIDAGVAVLDGVGLLLFVLPGIIAFAIDFGTGAIYLPGTAKSSSGLKNIKVLTFDPRHSTDESLENIIKKETGYDIKFSRADMQVTRLRSTDNVKATLAKISQLVKA
jgi:hypothetical protein